MWKEKKMSSSAFWKKSYQVILWWIIFADRRKKLSKPSGILLDNKSCIDPMNKIYILGERLPLREFWYRNSTYAGQRSEKKLLERKKIHTTIIYYFKPFLFNVNVYEYTLFFKWKLKFQKSHWNRPPKKKRPFSFQLFIFYYDI